MATDFKTFPQLGRSTSESRRIAQLAGETPLFEAQRWFARERTWINEQQLQLCRIAAPTFFEAPRAEWFNKRLEDLGWTSKIDRAGNVLAVFGSGSDQRPFVVSAHLDTVFAPGRAEEVYYAPDGRLHGPGSSDNGAGLAALLAIARVISVSPDLHQLGKSILLAANVGEEGEGNLSGMRFICRQLEQPDRIQAFIVLDGPSIDHITVQALASRRYEVLFSGAGGHSWNDSGTANPVHAISHVISSFVNAAEARCSADRRNRCSYNFGIIEGGNSINSIPSVARAKLDLRSADPSALEELANLLNFSVERSIERENRSARTSRLTGKIKELGSRPGGKLREDAPLLKSIAAVDSYLNIRSRIDCASTDANVPLSLGLPAVSIGAGGQGGGAHTRDEWYQPDGRELGLRRILLLVAALERQGAEQGEASS
ncbi:MAG: M20/M25/M40 family metallo-hydrolase [Acidobacteriaceae bacterium]|nr:M20/M25/M40 family metallo-hydrolase [Acidobacteriaceae bacterium]